MESKKNQSTEFEKLVANIEEVLREDTSLKVFHNYKIRDSADCPYQLDVVLKKDLGKRLGTILIPIECKNWNSKKVERRDIDAFINLLDSLNLSKGIFVSKIGYQSGAIKKAQSSGRVLLQTLDNLSKSELLKWIGESPLKRVILEPIIENVNFGFETKTPISDLAEIRKANPLEITLEIDGRTENLFDRWIKTHFSYTSKSLFQILKEGKRINGKNFEEYKIKCQFKISNVQNLAIVYNSFRIELEGLRLNYLAKIKFEEAVNSSILTYKELATNETLAEISSAEFENIRVDIIANNFSKFSGVATYKDSERVVNLIDFGIV